MRSRRPTRRRSHSCVSLHKRDPSSHSADCSSDCWSDQDNYRLTKMDSEESLRWSDDASNSSDHSDTEDEDEDDEPPPAIDGVVPDAGASDGAGGVAGGVAGGGVGAAADGLREDTEPGEDFEFQGVGQQPGEGSAEGAALVPAPASRPTGGSATVWWHHVGFVGFVGGVGGTIWGSGCDGWGLWAGWVVGCCPSGPPHVPGRARKTPLQEGQYDAQVTLPSCIVPRYLRLLAVVAPLEPPACRCFVSAAPG